MSDLKLGPVIGKLGGASVETTPINFPGESGSGVHDVLTVPVPHGVEHAVALRMTSCGATSSQYSAPRVAIGDQSPRPFSNYSTLGLVDVVRIVSGPVTIRTTRTGNSESDTDAFTGEVMYFPTGN